ncbi:MAG: hypothetical protein ABSC19_09900 [Syntrophorhabdales bacterium]
MMYWSGSCYDIGIKAGRRRHCLYCVRHCPIKAIKLEGSDIEVIHGQVHHLPELHRGMSALGRGSRKEAWAG